MITLASSYVDADGAAMREIMAHHLAAVAAAAPPSLRAADFWPDLETAAAADGWLPAIRAMPADWWGEIGAVGTPDDALGYLARLEEAGAHELLV